MVCGHSFVLVPGGRPNNYNKWKQDKTKQNRDKTARRRL